MIVGTKSRLWETGHVPILISSDPIERVCEFKYLAVYLDECLTFDRHIKYVYNKASSKLGVIRKERECVDRPTALRLYKGLVLLQHDYCDTIYMTASKESLKKLQLLQNSACRTLLLSGHEAHIEDMHKELGRLYLNNVVACISLLIFTRPCSLLVT